MKTVNELTKYELIKVIANMHDTIQDWNCGYGIPDDESSILIRIGRECTKFAVENNDWEIKDL